MALLRPQVKEKNIRPIPHAQLRPHCNVQWLFEPHKMSQTVLSLVAVPCRNRLQLYLNPQCAHGIFHFHRILILHPAWWICCAFQMFQG